MKTGLMVLSISAIVGLILVSCQETKSPDSSGMDLTKRVKSQGLKKLTVSVGSEMFIDMNVHGSVGFSADYKIGDKKVVNLIRSKLTYLRPERMKPGMTGGDAAKERFFFKAVNPGTTDIQLITEDRKSVV